MANPLTGPYSNNRDGVSQVTTVNRVDEFRHGIDTIPHSHAQEVATDVVEASSTTTVLNVTGHLARRGDVIRFTSGADSGIEVSVLQVAANTITLAQELSAAPGVGITFAILRYMTPLTDSSGRLQVDIVSQDALYALRWDDTGVGGISYVGEASPGSVESAAVWRIKRVTELNDDITVVWADGDSDFNNIWDDRAILTYS